MRVDDQYPCTADIPFDTEDLVLGTLLKARGRIQEDWTAASYIGKLGAVCAYGAVMVGEGITFDEAEAARMTAPSARAYVAHFEGRMRDTAKEALALVNAAAVELYPESAKYEASNWNGPIEWINQAEKDMIPMPPEGNVLDRNKAAVLACYDRAIEYRIDALMNGDEEYSVFDDELELVCA